MHAWLWQKISLETAAALEVEGRQTLCFLFITEAQCWKIIKIDSLKENGFVLIFMFKTVDSSVDFWRQNSNFEKHVGLQLSIT